MARRAACAGDPRIAVAYVRVSTEEQRLGPQAQRSTIDAWAAREGVSVASWHVDDGVSGGSPIDKRPALLAALAAVRVQHAGVLVIAKRDRIARDVEVAILIDREVRKAGARLISADGAGNGDEPQDGFMRTVIDGAAAYERALIQARTKAALAVKKKKRERTGSCPFGYRTGADGVSLVQDAVEQSVIAQVFRLREGGLSEREIAKELRPTKYRGRSGQPLAQTQVHRILGQTSGEKEDERTMTTTMMNALEDGYRELVLDDPEWARMVEINRGRLLEGFYPEWFVDACFQNWAFKRMSPAEIYAFSLLYADLVTGKLCAGRVRVGDGPGADRDTEGNQRKLDRLPVPFSAKFQGGTGDDDGSFSWDRSIKLTRLILQPDKSDKVEVWEPKAPWTLPLEVGYTKVATTFLHTRMMRGVARWPYGSNDVIVLMMHSSFEGVHLSDSLPPVEKVTVRELAGSSPVNAPPVTTIVAPDGQPLVDRRAAQAKRRIVRAPDFTKEGGPCDVEWLALQSKRLYARGRSIRAIVAALNSVDIRYGGKELTDEDVRRLVARADE